PSLLLRVSTRSSNTSRCIAAKSSPAPPFTNTSSTNPTTRFRTWWTYTSLTSAKNSASNSSRLAADKVIASNENQQPKSELANQQRTARQAKSILLLSIL